MLCEIDRVNQRDPHLRRRWFRDDYFDIFTWQAADGGFVGFQLCYDLVTRERVLSWRAGKGYTHDRVDDGGLSPFNNMTPIMVADGVMPLMEVLGEFDLRAGTIVPAVRDFLRQHLRDYVSRDNPGKPGKIDKPNAGV